MRSHAIPDDEPAHVLSGVPLFAGLDRVTLAKLAAHFERVRFGPGEIVFREGDPGDAFYVVLHGTFSDYVGVAGYGRRPAARDAGPGGDVRRDRPPLEPASLDHGAGRRGGRGAQARAGPVPRTGGQGARGGARDRGGPQRARVARQRSRGGNRRGPGPGGGRRPGDRGAAGWSEAAERRSGSLLRRALGGTLAAADPRRDVGDAAPRGAGAGRLARPRDARRHGARPRPRGAAGGDPGAADDRRVDARRRRAGPGGARGLRDAELGPRRGGAGLRRGAGLDGLLYRLALGIVGRARGGFAGQAAALALAGSPSARRSRTRPAASPSSRRLSAS